MNNALAFAFAGAFLAIGTAAMIAPAMSSKQYGVASDDADALGFVRALGARDFALGGIVLATIERPQLRRAVYAYAATIGLADAVVLFTRRGVRFQHVVHLGGAVALALAAGSERPERN